MYFSPPLDQMDQHHRNLRIYERLKGEGLYVELVLGPGEHGGIEYLRVSSGIIKDQQDQG